jgi:RNA polymerase sigma factor (sigma-70 family)
VVWRVCRALLPPADAEDAWSETFAAALGAYPRLRPDSNVRGWLVTIAHRKAIDQLRGTARRPVPQADPTEPRPGSTAPAADPFDHQDLATALESLAPKQKLCVVYRYLGDVSYEDIARELDISVAAARRNAADGIAKLRRHPSLAAPPAADRATHDPTTQASPKVKIR